MLCLSYILLEISSAQKERMQKESFFFPSPDAIDDIKDLAPTGHCFWFFLLKYAPAHLFLKQVLWFLRTVCTICYVITNLQKINMLSYSNLIIEHDPQKIIGYSKKIKMLTSIKGKYDTFIWYIQISLISFTSAKVEKPILTPPKPTPKN